MKKNRGKPLKLQEPAMSFAGRAGGKTGGGNWPKPKKSLGQNFLTSPAAIRKIIAAAGISPAGPDKQAEVVLEVGPGRGELTGALLTAGAQVIAVEKDRDLIDKLRTKFSPQTENDDGQRKNGPDLGRLKIISGDILEIKPEELGLAAGNYKIVANLPYYLTGQFLRKFLGGGGRPKTMVLLLQKEVVERIIAADGKESILSISVKAAGRPKKIAVVGRGSFFPPPNVDSAIIAIENISNKFFDSISEEKFFEVVRAGFAHKRKKLVSNLTAVAPKEKIIALFAALGIPSEIRAEEVRPEQWKQIAEGIGR